jgi:hypothetical protein
MKSGKLLLMMLLALIGQTCAAATYRYLGNDFTLGPNASPSPEPAFGQRLTAVAEFDSSITPDFTGTLSAEPGNSTHLVSYSLSVGVFALSSNSLEVAEAFLPRFNFINGVIESWELGLRSNDFFRLLHTFNTGCCNGQAVDFSSSSLITNTNGNYSFAPGAWTRVESVPVMPSGMLLATAIAAVTGVAFLSRRRDASAELPGA